MPWSVGLMHSSSQLLRQAGRSDLCSRHQHGSAGHSACFVIRVTQLCRINKVRRRLARDTGLVALATAHASSDLQSMDISWMARVPGHAACVCVCQIASQQLKRPSLTPAPKSSRLELYVCNCMLSGVMLSAQGTSRLRRVAMMTAACLLGSATGNALRMILVGVDRLIQLA